MRQFYIAGREIASQLDRNVGSYVKETMKEVEAEAKKRVENGTEETVYIVKVVARVERAKRPVKITRFR